MNKKGRETKILFIHILIGILDTIIIKNKVKPIINIDLILIIGMLINEIIEIHVEFLINCLRKI